LNDQINKEPENLDDFLNALASALLAWQRVESNLFLIFNFLAGPHEQPAVLSAVYHSVIHLRPRLNMVNAAAAVVLKDDLSLDVWNKLSERISKSAGRRNNLAHFGLVSHTDIEGRTKVLLKPSIFNINAKPDAEYNIKQIDEWRLSFITLSSDLSKFLDNLPAVLQALPRTSP
jgi:hypothetical protein